ncbi:MAG: hypothetical protein K6G03_08630 [Lachnospiraceae bacterium]|nr:hypothetical protein [Lachnospiraceae bacterium]
MENETTGQKGFFSSARNLTILQLLMLAPAFAVACGGAFYSYEVKARISIYVAQAILCVIIFFCSRSYIKGAGAKYFRAAIYACATVEGLRAALIHTEGIVSWAAVCSKLLLIIAACACVALNERLDKKKDSIILSAVILSAEILLYGVFILGFPAVRGSMVYSILPLVGVIISATVLITVICLWRFNRD